MGVLGDPLPLRGTERETPQQPGEVAAGKLLAEQRRGEGVDPLERIRPRQLAIAATVGAPTSSSAASRESSVAGGPSSEATEPASEARSERPALSESAIEVATSGSERSTARR